MPRFVLLHHDHPRGAHWDFMLEDGPILATWALPEMPASGMTLEAERLFDHRLAFLEYEGPLSPGLGSVERIAGGEFETLFRDDIRWIVRLNSSILPNHVELIGPGKDEKTWRCEFSSESPGL